MKWLLQTRLWSAFASRSTRLMFASHCLRLSSLNFLVSSPWYNSTEGNRKIWNFPFSPFELWLQPNTAQRCGLITGETNSETIPASAEHVRGKAIYIIVLSQMSPRHISGILYEYPQVTTWLPLILLEAYLQCTHGVGSSRSAFEPVSCRFEQKSGSFVGMYWHFDRWRC